MWLVGKVCQEKNPLLSKKNIAAWIRIVQLHLNKSQDFNNIFWADETKVQTSGHNAQCHIWRKPNKAYQHKYLKPTEYSRIACYCHCTGVLIWACFAAIELTINSFVYSSILESNRKPSVQLLIWPKLGHAVKRDPKQSCKSTVPQSELISLLKCCI